MKNEINFLPFDGWTLSRQVSISNNSTIKGSLAYCIDVQNKAYTARQLVDVEPGLYRVSVLVWADGSLGDSYLEVNGKKTVIISTGSVQIDNSRTWDEIALDKVLVEDVGQLDITIVISDNVEVLEGYWTGVSYTKIQDLDATETFDIGEKRPAKQDSYIMNHGFEDGARAWTLGGGEIVSSGHDESLYALIHTGETGVKDTWQTISNLTDGYYTLTAYVQNNGGHKAAYMYAKNSQGHCFMTAIPRTNFPHENEPWKKVTVRGISVVNGSLTVGLFSDSTDMEQYIILDNIHLEFDNKPYELLIGGDMSEVSYVEAMGGRYFDENGEESDVFKLMARSGWNVVRIIEYVKPGKGRGDGVYYRPAGFGDSQDAIRLCLRAKKAGLQIVYSFHYSDYWTNPGCQMIPHDWLVELQDKSDNEAVAILESKVYEHTKRVLLQLKEQNTPPEYVALGNETRSGMLHPYGEVNHWDNLSKFYNAGAKAVREVLPNAKIIIHLDNGGNVPCYIEYFDQAENHKVDYDIIGSSFYPFWTGKGSADFAVFVDTIAKRYKKPIICMETGFNWTGNTGVGSPGQLSHNGPYGDASSTSKALQRDFMIDLFNAMKGVDDGMCIGDLYWDPIMIYANGRVGWSYRELDDQVEPNIVDNTALFDFDGKLLPVIDAYRYNK